MPRTIVMARGSERGIRATWPFVVALVLACTAAGATDYYVNGFVGDDSNSGRTPRSAWRTIQKAANTMPPGGVCNVSPWIYSRVRISRSGEPGAPLTFRAMSGPVMVAGFTVGTKMGPISHVVIEGFDISLRRDEALDAWGTGTGIALVDTQYCEVRYNRIHNTLREGILVCATDGDDSDSSSHNRVFANHIDHAGSSAGINVNGAAQIIEGNEISHTLQHPLYPALSKAEDPDADGIRFAGRDHVFRDNYIHDILRSDTGNVDPHIDAFETSGPAWNILFEGNVIALPTEDGASYAATISQAFTPVRDLTLRYNVITAFRGLSFSGEPAPVPRVTVANNTFYGVRDYDVELRGCPEAVVKNNAISASGRYMYADPTPATGHNGVPDPLPLYPDDNRIMDPCYVDPAQRNFRLQLDSPLIDGGADLGLMADFLGTRVPQGDAPDIGAFEYIDPAYLGALNCPFFEEAPPQP